MMSLWPRKCRLAADIFFMVNKQAIRNIMEKVTDIRRLSGMRKKPIL